MDRSPHLRHQTKSQGGVSDSELSTETNSLSAESNNDNGRSPVKSTPSGTDVQAAKSKQRRKGAEWEVIDSFKTLRIFDQAPTKLEGFLLKKRKWPLKGWHKVVVRVAIPSSGRQLIFLFLPVSEILHLGERQPDVRQTTRRFGSRETARFGGSGSLGHFCQAPALPHRH